LNGHDGTIEAGASLMPIMPIGARLAHLCGPWDLPGGSRSGVRLFCIYRFDAVSTTAQEAKNPQRDLPIGIIASLLICTILYISVAGVLTGMVRWQDVNIEAPIARAFLDRGLATASHIVTLGALAGLDERDVGHASRPDRVLYSMANDGLLPRKFFAAIHPKSAHRIRTPCLLVLLAAIVGSVTPIDDIGKMVNIGTLLASVIVLHCRHDSAQHQSRSSASLPYAMGAGRTDSRILFNGYMMYKLAGSLGSPDCVVDHRPGDLFHLQPLPTAASATRSSSNSKTSF